MPTFCRHNRFIERCPICSKTLPGGEAESAPRPAARGPRVHLGAARRPQRALARQRACACTAKAARRTTATARRWCPACDASADATRLAEEIAFAGGRLLALAAEPPGTYGEARALAGDDLEAGHLDLLSDELPLAARGRGPLRRHPHRAGRRSAARSRGHPARSAHEPRPRARGGDAARLPPVGRAPGGRVRRRPRLERTAALRAAVRAARAPRLRAHGPL